MRRSRILPLIFLAACTHSTPIEIEPPLPQGPWDPPGQLTFHIYNDFTPTWTPDGEHLLYSFPERGQECLAIIPAAGGTRSFTLCDTRGALADSSRMFVGAAFRPTGELSFLQANSAIGALSPKSFSMTLVDTVAPLGRRQIIAVFPKPVGDSVVGLLQDVVWTDADHFLARGARMLITSIKLSNNKDTVYSPQFMVRGTMSGTTAQLAQIPGTVGVAQWTLDPNGDILFVRGVVGGIDRISVIEERTILRISQSGGAASAIGTAPAGSSIRSIHCRATCLVLTGNRNPIDPTSVTGSVLYRFNPATLTFSSLGSPGHNLNTWRTPQLNLDGTKVVYASAGNLFVVAIPQ